MKVALRYLNVFPRSLNQQHYQSPVDFSHIIYIDNPAPRTDTLWHYAKRHIPCYWWKPQKYSLKTPLCEDSAVGNEDSDSKGCVSIELTRHCYFMASTFASRCSLASCSVGVRGLGRRTDGYKEDVIYVEFWVYLEIPGDG